MQGRLTLGGYLEESKPFAVYPEFWMHSSLFSLDVGESFRANRRVYYPALGLVDEVSELVELWRGDPPRKSSALCAELGDVIWYWAALVRDADLDLGDVVSVSLDHIEGDGVAFASPTDIVFRLVVWAGKAAGVVKKVARDHGGLLVEQKEDALIEALGRVLAGLTHLAALNGWSLSTVMDENLKKLRSRQARGVLRGDGDDR